MLKTATNKLKAQGATLARKTRIGHLRLQTWTLPNGVDLYLVSNNDKLLSIHVNQQTFRENFVGEEAFDINCANETLKYFDIKKVNILFQGEKVAKGIFIKLKEHYFTRRLDEVDSGREHYVRNGIYTGFFATLGGVILTDLEEHGIMDRLESLEDFPYDSDYFTDWVNSHLEFHGNHESIHKLMGEVVFNNTAGKVIHSAAAEISQGLQSMLGRIMAEMEADAKAEAEVHTPNTDLKS